MPARYCACCGKAFASRPQVPHQTYCSAPACQRERKQRWHRNKLQTDPDYRDNQHRTQRDWLNRHPDYWRQYREEHPLSDRRCKSAIQTKSRSGPNPRPAKMDVSPVPIPAGIYWLKPILVEGSKRRPLWTVEIWPVTATQLRKMDAC